jgi:hypothetical protein
VTLIFGGHDAGSAGRCELGVVDCDVRITLHENCFVRRCSAVVSCADALDTAFVAAALETVALRIDHVNASMSSKMMEWMRRCMLLWRVWSNK